jgi:hypothetical protein
MDGKRGVIGRKVRKIKDIWNFQALPDRPPRQAIVNHDFTVECEDAGDGFPVP